MLANSATLFDPTYDELLAMIGNTQPPRSPLPLIEASLAAIALVALALGISGVLRARRPRRLWRLLPPLIPVAVFAAYPQWTSALMNGRTVTWAQLNVLPGTVDHYVGGRRGGRYGDCAGASSMASSVR